MANENYFNTPCALVFIGGQYCEAESFNIELTANGESAKCDVDILMEAIDSTIFAKQANEQTKVEIAVYTGYIADQKDSVGYLSQVRQLINSQSERNKILKKRFEGFVAQPTWTFGDSEKVRLTCFDWSQLLRQYKWVKNLKDGDTEISRIISIAQNKLGDYKIKADNYTGSQRLGERDADSNSRVYRAEGKSVWEVLKECAEKLNKNIFIEGRTIYITKYKDKPVEWSLYYASLSNQKNLKTGQFFTEASFRYGDIGESSKGNVVVDLYSSKLTKKGDAKATYVRYPENAPIKQNTLYIKRYVKVNSEESELRTMAENIYKKHAKKVMTGDITLPFANNAIDIYDLVRFVCDDPNNQINFIKDYYFSVNSVSESYGNGGYTQTIEIETDPDINKNTVSYTKLPAPKPVKKK